MTLVLLVAALGLVRRDYRRGDRLSTAAVVAVWAAYLVHLAVTVWFAWVPPIGRIPVPTPPAYLVGGFLCGVGVTLTALGMATFRSFERMSGLDTSRLVTDGMYAFSRDPQNLGWFTALLGAAVAGRSPAALGLVAIFAVVVHLYIVRLEEPHLEQLYGEEYRAYRRRTPRYLGLPGASS